MKIKVCDVCYHTEKGFTQSTWRLGRRNKLTGESIRMDACDKHKNFLKGAKTVAEARKIIHDLVY